MNDEFSFQYLKLIGDEQKTFNDITQFIQDSLDSGNYSRDLIYKCIVNFCSIDNRADILEYIYEDAKKILHPSKFEEALKASFISGKGKTSIFFLDKDVQIDLAKPFIRNYITSLSLDVIKKLDEKGFRVNDSDGYVLCMSIGKYPPRFDIVDYFESCGANIEDNHELWMYAGSTWKDDFKNKIDYLLSKGLSITCENSELTKQAIKNDFPDILQYIISLGADLQYDPQSLLLECATNSDTQIIEILLKNEIILHQDNDELMQTAAEKGNIPIVKFLLKHGLNRDIAQRYGTPEIKELCAREFSQQMEKELSVKTNSNSHKKNKI